ncbi:MAG: glycosyltransferase family 39 protein [Candidatus Omnitrophica bacterium]|nr:glycosyltransferase family 39 protein [Candidatus Omnitrophota bacterium]
MNIPNETQERSDVWARFGYHGLFGLILIVATLVRWNFLRPDRLWPDEALYAWSGLRIFQNFHLAFSKEIIQFHPPLFSILLAIGHFFASPPEFACHMVSVIINIIGIVAIYFLGLRISSRFLGLFATMSLSFNYFYLNSSTYILIDSPLAVFFCFLALALLNISETNPRRYDGYVGLMGAAVILLKWSGVLVIPFIISFYLLAFRELSWGARAKKLLIPLSIILGTCLLLLINNLVQMGSFLPDISALKGVGKPKPIWYYIGKIHNILILWQILPFFVYGFYICVKKKAIKDVLLLTWFAVFLIGISLTAEKESRYALPILPCCLLIAGIGVETFLEKIFKSSLRIEKARLFSILLFLFFYWQSFPRLVMLVEGGLNSGFGGYKEAAEWIKAVPSEDAWIISSSRREIRYYSGINFKEFGGRLREFPKNQDEFEGFLGKVKEPIFVELGRWDWALPPWIFPFTEEKQKYLEGLGFKLRKEVKKELLTINQKKEILPVLWIFER